MCLVVVVVVVVVVVSPEDRYQYFYPRYGHHTPAHLSFLPHGRPPPTRHSPTHLTPPTTTPHSYKCCCYEGSHLVYGVPGETVVTWSRHAEQSVSKVILNNTQDPNRVYYSTLSHVTPRRTLFWCFKSMCEWRGQGGRTCVVCGAADGERRVIQHQAHGCHTTTDTFVGCQARLRDAAPSVACLHLPPARTTHAKNTHFMLRIPNGLTEGYVER